MTQKVVECVRLKKQAEALAKAPYPGELGLKILQQVSKQGCKNG